MGARGIFAERIWHRTVQRENAIRLKKLIPVGKSNAAEVKMLAKAFHRTRRFSKADLSDLTTMEVGEYLLPDNDQFPAVDEIAVLNHDPWKSEEASTEAEQRDGSTCVGILLQMAIGGNHKRPKGQTLVDIDNKMSKITLLASPGRPYTESADSWSYHTYTTKKGKSYSIGATPRRLGEIQQFAMSFPKLTG